MTSEIRANTIKNRVGLGTVSFTNTGPVVSGIVTANGLELNSVDTGSSADPEIKLYRNSASPADADYLGQVKFAGESDTGVERNYAKITGKILDASNGTEDGILEFAHIKGGSQTITGRWRSDSLQLLNDTNLSVAGDTTLTSDLDVDGHTNLDNVSIAGVTTFSTSPVVPNGGYYKGIINSGSQEKIVGGYISGTDTLRLGESMYLTSTGLGINESSPSQRLHVGGDVQIGFNTPNDAGRQINFNVNRSSAGQTLANINWQWNNKFVAQIRGIAGSDTTNKDDAHLAFFTSSANNLTARLRIHPDGGVTIGDIAATTTKAGILHTRVSTTTRPVVFENDTENSDVVIKTTGTNKHSILGFGDGASNFAGNIDYDHQNNAMVFDTNGGERLNISSSGVITQVETGTGNGHGGIKASTASGGGNAGFGFITAGTQRFNVTTIGSAGSEALRVYDNNNSAERLRIDSSGRMMIGNTAAGQMYSGADNLVIGTTSGENGITIISQSNSIGRILFSDSLTSGAATYQGQLNYNHSADELVISTYTLGQIVMKTSNTERLRILANGNIKFATDNSTTDYLQYGNNPRLWLKCPDGINGLRIDANTTPLEIRRTNGDGRSISIGSGANFDLSVSGDYSLSSSSQRDNSPTIFLNTTRWNGSTTVTSFQTSIQAVTTSNNNNIGYLGFGASASPQNITIHTDNHICLAENVTSDLTDTCLVRIASTFKNTVRNGSGRCVERGFYSMNTGSGSVDYFHMKTDMATNSGCMFLFTLRGYAYGQGKVMFAQTCGYCYSATNTIINDQNKSWDGDTILSTYKSSDGYVVLRAYLSSWSSYYTGFHIDVSYQNPATGTMKYKVTGSAINNASDHYA